MVKALIILILTVAIFGTGAYFTYELYVKPVQVLQKEKAQGPPAPPPDPSLADFAACVALKGKGNAEATRSALIAFLDHYPHSTKVDEARDLLGEINVDLFFSSKPAPEKQVYIVAKNDVLNRVAMRTHSTPELIFRSNNLTRDILRIGQTLVIAPADFAAIISLKEKRLTLYNAKRLFKQYRVLTVPERDAARTAGNQKRVGKVVSKLATDAAGNRVTFQDKSYAGALHEISLSIAGHSLYPVVPAPATGGKPVVRSGIGLSPEDMEEIAVLLKKNDPVTIE